MKKIHLSVLSAPCFDFTTDRYQREKRTVIIAPITIQDLDIDTQQVGWACSRGRYCADKECVYAHGKED